MYNYDNELLFYHMTIFDAGICIMSALMMMGICHFISGLLPKAVISICAKIGANLNEIYIVQWVIIHWLVGFFIKGILRLKLSTGETILVSAFITILSVCIAEVISKRRAKARS